MYCDDVIILAETILGVTALAHILIPNCGLGSKLWANFRESETVPGTGYPVPGTWYNQVAAVINGPSRPNSTLWTVYHPETQPSVFSHLCSRMDLSQEADRPVHTALGHTDGDGVGDVKQRAAGRLWVTQWTEPEWNLAILLRAATGSSGEPWAATCRHG